MKYLTIALRLIAAGILLQTLFFKFTAAPESVFIFSTLGAEPWGRLLSGVMELAAGAMLLIPASRLYGALLSCAIMSGALLSHVFVLGISVQNDGGLLFALACTVFVSCAAVLLIEREQALDNARRLLRVLGVKA